MARLHRGTDQTNAMIEERAKRANRSIENYLYKCAIKNCGEKFFVKEDWEFHTRQHGLGDWLACPDCDEEFMYPAELSRHRRKNHLSDSEKAKDLDKRTCCHCGKVFSRVNISVVNCSEPFDLIS